MSLSKILCSACPLVNYSPKILGKARPTLVITLLLCGSCTKLFPFYFTVLSSKACGLGWEMGWKGKTMRVFAVAKGVLVD